MAGDETQKDWPVVLFVVCGLMACLVQTGFLCNLARHWRLNPNLDWRVIGTAATAIFTGALFSLGCFLWRTNLVFRSLRFGAKSAACMVRFPLSLSRSFTIVSSMRDCVPKEISNANPSSD